MFVSSSESIRRKNFDAIAYWKTSLEDVRHDLICTRSKDSQTFREQFIVKKRTIGVYTNPSIEPEMSNAGVHPTSYIFG